LGDTHGVGAEAAKTDKTKLGVFEGNRLFGSPFKVGENLDIGEIDFNPKRPP
jgi:hypothetical protein